MTLDDFAVVHGVESGMRFGSVCSGIEAASAAWKSLGWEAAWFSEIEPFPCAVLKHHYPEVPNLGDMTTLPARILAGEVEAPDILVGGTPCQSFSVAGLRQGLKDPRGQLTRTFVEICDAIDAVRAAAGKPPVVLVWENVPGVLSDRDNAFGNFLGALSGEDGALEPPGGKWTNAGLVCGPARNLAWRVLDAQYFGVAQRRRRVFLVGHSRAGSLRPVKVLLVEPGVRRDSPPSREAGQRAAPTLAARTRGGGGLGTDFDLDGGLVRYDGGRGVAWGISSDALDRSGEGAEKTAAQRAGLGIVEQAQPTLRARANNSVAHVVAPSVFPIDLRQAARGERNTNDRLTGGAPGTGIGEEGDPAYTVSERQQGVAHVVAPPLTATNDPSRSPQSSEVTAQVEAALRAQYPLAARTRVGGDDLIPEIAACLETTSHDYSRADGFTMIAHPLAAAAHAPAVAFQPRIARNGRGDMGVNALNAQSGETGKGDAAPCVATAMAVRRLTPVEHASGETTYMITNYRTNTFSETNLSSPLTTSRTMFRSAPLAAEMAVRRLTPVECERLQGFPDDYTLIPWKRKPASECPDGPRYKALGNSMAVPVMRWIGRQIQRAR